MSVAPGASANGPARGAVPADEARVSRPTRPAEEGHSHAQSAVAGAALEKTEVARPSKPSGTLRLTVHIERLRNSKGKLAVALFADPDSFPDQSKAKRGQLAAIVGRGGKVQFEGLKAGTYAIAVLHDENGNEKMDFNWLGMPLEGYGFSRDATGFLGPPSFKDAALLIKSDARTSIKVRYFDL